jgi:hypothetical protein
LFEISKFITEMIIYFNSDYFYIKLDTNFNYGF